MARRAAERALQVAGLGPLLLAAMSLIAGCYSSLDESSVKCRVDRERNCPSGLQCRALAGAAYGMCCRPGDLSCGAADASTSIDGPGFETARADSADVSIGDARPESVASTGGIGGQAGGSGGSIPGAGTGGVTTGGVPGTGGVSATGGVSGRNGGGAGSGMPGTGGVLSAGGMLSAGGVRGTGGLEGTGGLHGTGGRAGTGGTPGTGGAIPGTGGALPPATTLVTSGAGAYWQSGTWTEVTTGAPDVTVNDNQGQVWEGFGGCFNEMGWEQINGSPDEAIGLLFGKDGCNFAWGRIPMGASDYATSRYTCDDTGDDVPAESGDANRPGPDSSMSNFSLDRDKGSLIKYIQAAQKVKPDLRFWASPWTPPPWMKTGFKTDNGSGGTAKKPSYFDGGNFKNDASYLTAYADYYKRFVQGYKDAGIKIEVVSPQNEPGYDQNYPSCLWDKTTYVSWIKALGPVMKDLGVGVMLGSMSNAGDNSRNDMDIAAAVLADSTAKSFLSVGGAQWGVLEKLNSGSASFGGLPVWASEHKCGNYPWNPSTGCGDSGDSCPRYNSTQAPNDHAYAVESWKYIRNAINKGKVTAYNAWNMVLDKIGLGNDTSRDWRQNALLTVDGGRVTKTPTYYVFRHLSQFVVPGAKVVTASNTDVVAFKNPDGSFVAVMYSKSGKSNYIVSIGGKLLQFNLPADGWATIVYK